jgi:hypothetical protein
MDDETPTPSSGRRGGRAMPGCLAAAALALIATDAGAQAPAPARAVAIGKLAVTGSAPLQHTTIASAYSGTQNPGGYGIVAHEFDAFEDFGSFGDDKTHIGMAVLGGKSLDAAATSGSWQLQTVDYRGFGGSSPHTFITAGEFVVSPKPGARNNRGNWTALNPVCIVKPGTAPDACVGDETDIVTAVAPANVRQGLRIVDVHSRPGTYGRTTDSAIGVGNEEGIGFRSIISLGDTGQPTTFPLPAGGAIIRSAPTRTVIGAAIDLDNIAPPSKALIVAPAGSPPAPSRLACWGPGCTGGALLSTTAVNAGQLVFSSNMVSVNWAHAVLTIDSAGGLTVSGPVTAASLTLTDLPVRPDNNAARAAGLPRGRLYRTADGTLKVVF